MEANYTALPVVVKRFLRLRGIEWKTTMLRYSDCDGALAEIVFNWRKIDSARCAIEKGYRNSFAVYVVP